MGSRGREEHTCRTSRALSPQAETVTGKEPGSDPPADLGDPAGRPRGSRDLAPSGRDGWRQARQGPHPTATQKHPHGPLGTAPSSLLVPETTRHPQPSASLTALWDGRPARRNPRAHPQGASAIARAGPRWTAQLGPRFPRGRGGTNQPGTESRVIHTVRGQRPRHQCELKLS